MPGLSHGPRIVESFAKQRDKQERDHDVTVQEPLTIAYLNDTGRVQLAQLLNVANPCHLFECLPWILALSRGRPSQRAGANAQYNYIQVVYLRDRPSRLL